MDININYSEPPTITSIPEKTQATPPEVLIFEPDGDKRITLRITKNLSNTDSNVNMVEGISTSIIDTSAIQPPPLSPPSSSTINFKSIQAVSPTFQGVINEPIFITINKTRGHC